MEKERPIDRIKALAQWLIEHKVIKSMYAFEKGDSAFCIIV